MASAANVYDIHFQMSLTMLRPEEPLSTWHFHLDVAEKLKFNNKNPNMLLSSNSVLPTFSNIKSGITIYSIFQVQNLEIIVESLIQTLITNNNHQ